MLPRFRPTGAGRRFRISVKAPALYRWSALDAAGFSVAWAMVDFRLYRGLFALFTGAVMMSIFVGEVLHWMVETAKH